MVNSLLIFIEQIEPQGFVVAATNLDAHLDPAIWRRFDEIVWFEQPDDAMIRKYLGHVFCNTKVSFDPASYSDQLQDYSYADLERVCVQALKLSVLGGNKAVSEADFRQSLRDAERRRMRKQKLEGKAGE